MSWDQGFWKVLLAHELKEQGFQVERQVPVSIQYRGIHFEEGYRLDLLVENLVVIEVKSVELIAPIHKKQLLCLPIFDSPINRLVSC